MHNHANHRGNNKDGDSDNEVPLAHTEDAPTSTDLGARPAEGEIVSSDTQEADMTDLSQQQTPAEFWESRYLGKDSIWSGKVNQVLADVASTLTPGRALDLGCGEGGDALWLAENGWTAVGVDLSPTAVERGMAAARQKGLPFESVRLEAGDLTTWNTNERFDLVTCSYLHSWPAEIPRDEILHRSTGFVAPGGHLLVTSHAEPPPWADPESSKMHSLPTPESDFEALQLDPAKWEAITVETRERVATGPEGVIGELKDGVVLVRRL